MTRLYPHHWSPAEQAARNALLTARQRVFRAWAAALAHDGFPKDAIFVILSPDNPHREELDAAAGSVEAAMRVIHNARG